MDKVSVLKTSSEAHLLRRCEEFSLMARYASLSRICLFKISLVLAGADKVSEEIEFLEER